VDILAWLRELGLERYEQAFQENEIAADILPKLTADDLKDIGVTIVGHRRKLLEAIAALAEPALARQAEPRAPGEAPPTARPSAAERRQLTVMFVDLVGSTALSAALDPEEMGAAIRVYQNAVAGEILRFEGPTMARGPERLRPGDARRDHEFVFRRTGRGSYSSHHRSDALLRFCLDVSDRMHADGPLALRHSARRGRGGCNGRDASVSRQREAQRSPRSENLGTPHDARSGQA
jgi:class 3 adenylate cyclase